MLPETGHHLDAEQYPDEAHVQAHVAVENMAEFMPDHALQLIPVQPIQRAPRDGNDGLVLIEAGSKRIDGAFALHHIDARTGDAGGDRHFFDHVLQPALLRLAGRRQHQPPSGHPRDGVAAFAQTQDFNYRAAADQGDGD